MADIRTGLTALLGALGVAGGLAYTAKTFRLSQTAQLTDRFQNASKQMGDGNATVRVAGIHAMAQLADEWVQQRQRCIDVLCAYLRFPGDGDDARRKADLEARRTIIGLIGERLRSERAQWQRCKFDFTGAFLDVGDFRGVCFAKGGQFLFRDVRFTGTVKFDHAEFAGAAVSFANASFEGSGLISFDQCLFRGGELSFEEASFSGGRVSFSATFEPGCSVTFAQARLGAGGSVSFEHAELKGEGVSFSRAIFAEGHGEVSFRGARFAGRVTFEEAEFHRDVFFDDIVMSSGAELSLEHAKLRSGRLSFHGARCAGATFRCEGIENTFGGIDLGDSEPGIEGVAPGSSLFSRTSDRGASGERVPHAD